jgi:2-isopropylmalate synthase
MTDNHDPRDKVSIFDTTLRDGEQAPGIALDPDKKVEIAHQLARLGVDIIEAGFPVSSPGDFEAVRRIAREVRGPVIAALARAEAEDIDRAWEALKFADQSRIHIFLATSPIHMEHKLRMSPEEVLTAVKTSVARAREYTSVEYSPEDATRSDPEFIVAACQTAVEAGATVINIPDTVGYATPFEYGALIARVVEEVKGDSEDVVISTHCHNDLGLAVANSLAAVKAGARQVEGAINGIGERAGNTSTEEVVMALKVRRDTFGVDVGVTTEEIFESSRLVAERTGYPVQFNKAVVGRNAFAHESGIHQHGVLRHRETYEIMDPSTVGQGSSLVMGKHSGRAAFRNALERIGVELTNGAFDKAFARLKEVADRSGEVSDSQLRTIVDDVVSGTEILQGVNDTFR